MQNTTKAILEGWTQEQVLEDIGSHVEYWFQTIPYSSSSLWEDWQAILDCVGPGVDFMSTLDEQYFVYDAMEVALNLLDNDLTQAVLLCRKGLKGVRPRLIKSVKCEHAQRLAKEADERLLGYAE